MARRWSWKGGYQRVKKVFIRGKSRMGSIIRRTKNKGFRIGFGLAIGVAFFPVIKELLNTNKTRG